MEIKEINHHLGLIRQELASKIGKNLGDGKTVLMDDLKYQAINRASTHPELLIYPVSAKAKFNRTAPEVACKMIEEFGEMMAEFNKVTLSQYKGNLDLVEFNKEACDVLACLYDLVYVVNGFKTVDLSSLLKLKLEKWLNRLEQ